MADPEEPKAEAEEPEVPRERAEAPAEPSADKPVKKKKAKAAAAAGSTEEIRDRNKRIREEAAAKRRAKREESLRRVNRNLDASEVVDDALARTSHALGAWLKRHFNVVQWVLVAGLVAWIGWEVYSWRTRRTVEKTSDELYKGLHAENGIVGEKPPEEPGFEDPRRVFPTDKERLVAAEKEYRAVAGSKAKAAPLAQLALAGVLYDSGKYKEAKEAYEAVKSSELAKTDRDARGRALEGLGMTLEALGDKDGALKAFRELENTDTLGFAALGLYHQARVHHGKGEVDKAKDLLTKADKKLKESKGPSVSGYLPLAIRELMQLIDPAAAAALSSVLPAELMEKLNEAGQDDGKGISKEKLDELIREMKERVEKDKDGAPAPAPAAPDSAQPAAPAQPAPAQPAAPAAPAPANKPAAPKPAPVQPAPAAPAPEAPAPAAPAPAAPAPETPAPAQPAPQPPAGTP